MREKYVQYGCGLEAPIEWENYDVSPTLRLQKIPFIGKSISRALGTKFPDNVLYGDIIKGLPVAAGTCDGVYCSHTLEHLALADFHKALSNTFVLLKKEGVFRCVLPDLESYARDYIRDIDNSDVEASHHFMTSTYLGYQVRAKTLLEKIRFLYGNSKHLWMWDKLSLKHELEKIGFTSVRFCDFGDSEYKMFSKVEQPWSYEKALSFECIK